MRFAASVVIKFTLRENAATLSPRPPSPPRLSQSPNYLATFRVTRSVFVTTFLADEQIERGIDANGLIIVMRASLRVYVETSKK